MSSRGHGAQLCFFNKTIEPQKQDTTHTPHTHTHTHTLLTVGQSNHMGIPACVLREPLLKEGWEQVPNMFSLVR